MPTPTGAVVQAKRGSRLGLKGFLLSLCLAAGAMAASKGNTVADGISLALASGVGGGYIIVNLRRWKSDKVVADDAPIAWTVATLLLVVCVGVLIDLAIGHH